MTRYQAGNTPTRTEWIQETTVGEVPADPSWNLFSDNMASLWDWEPDANTQTQRGVGEINPQGFFNGSETHDATFEYHLQQWYVDGSDNTVDAGGDFLTPSADNDLRATHAVVSRSEHETGGSDDAGRRIYTVGKGGHPSSITVPFETEDGSPINQTLEYQFEKVRQYDISQPSAGTTLDVENTGTTSVDVTIEDEGAATSETLTVSGSSTQTSLETYDNIDAVELDTDTDGDVIVTDGSGTEFVRIKGSDSYPAGEGDLGIPALGSGSHATAIDSEYVQFIDDTLAIPDAPSEYEVISGELTVDTGLNDNAKTGSASRNIHPEAFEYTFTATLAGPKISVDQTVNYMTENTGTITWTAQEGSIVGNDAFIMSPGSYTKESENGKLTFDNEWMAQSLTVSN